VVAPRAAPEPGDLGCYDPEHVRRHAPRWKRLLHGYFRAEVRGMDRLPDGPFVAAGNHSGGVLIPDTLVWLSAYHSAGRATPLLTLAHDAMFSAYPGPVARWVARFGGIRAEPALALAALAQGSAVQVYPGGDHDACRSFARRHEVVFAGRTGYVALAQQAGVPIVPVASVGGHEALVILREGRRLARWLGLDRSRRLKAFPVSLSVPWGLWAGPLPGYVPLPARIEIEVLPPLDPAGDIAAVDARVRGALQDAVDAMARRRRFPWIG
jgi:1-acyl-sn-glycerol-3-phosphate acyltransferase